MAGYHNYSMSNNAVEAYASGRMPLSKWTKTAILEAAAEYTDDEAKLALLRKCTLATLKRYMLRCTEWHHTSSHYNTTNFYSFDELLLDEITPETVASWNAIEKDTPAAPAQPTTRKGTIHYIEWGGTRKRPKAYEKTLENVDIMEKGCFYLIFRNGAQILKKKIGSNGTHIIYDKKA